MKTITTRIFITASIAFGIIGLLIVWTSAGPDKNDTPESIFLIKLLFTCVFIILPSFALSVAEKYFSNKN
jgi:hypothetical protein